MHYVALEGTGPYLHNGVQCIIVEFDRGCDARKYAREQHGTLLKRTAHITFQGKVMSVASVAINEGQVADSLRAHAQSGLSAAAEISASHRRMEKRR
jgi:hypothetical protein